MRPVDDPLRTHRKDANEATAVLREIPGYGWEARLLFRGDLRQSHRFEERRLAEAEASEWRKDLEATGWIPRARVESLGMPPAAEAVMPFSYRVDPHSRIVLSTWSGTITAQELGHHWKDVLADPELAGCTKSIADLREAQLAFTGSELATMVGGVLLPGLVGRPWREAILVGAPDQYGTARQYSVYADGVTKHAIFTDEEAALAWLAGENR